MEDAHACVLDLKPEGAESEDSKPTAADLRLSFFGVYDGHGGDKVAIYAGENLHRIIAKQDAFKEGNIEQALKDGFLATDRSILSGEYFPVWADCAADVRLTTIGRPQVRRGSLRLHRFGRRHFW